jgi:chromosome segregation ATPase
MSASGTPFAQTARSGSNANAQALVQLQQLASERTALQAENARLKKELDDVRRDRDALKKKSDTGDSRAKASAAAVAASATQREAAEQQLKQTKEKMEQLIAKFRETAQTLREVETERNSAKLTLASRDQELKVCIDRNLALYKVNEEVLDRLGRQSVWSRVAAAEPFTRIKRTQMENLIDEYKSRAEDQRVTPELLQSGVARPPAAAAPPPANAAPQRAPTPPGPPETHPN